MKKVQQHLFIWFSLLFLLLSGCSTPPPIAYIPIHIEQVSQAQAWEVRGKIAVRTPEERFSANLYWFHTQEREELRLTTPIGTTVLQLTSTPELTQLVIDGQRYQHHDPQLLLQRATGWSIPIDSLPLWLTGQITAQDRVLQKDSNNRPISLLSSDKESHWQVSFLSWQQQSGAQIPKKMLLTHEQVEIKLQLNRWQALAPITDTEQNSNIVISSQEPKTLALTANTMSHLR